MWHNDSGTLANIIYAAVPGLPGLVLLYFAAPLLGLRESTSR
jgi:hypothetical protein